MMLLGLVGPLALMTAAAHSLPAAAAVPNPTGTSKALPLDEAAERLIRLCVHHALGSSDMTDVMQHVFPGHELKARRRLDGVEVNNSYYVDVETGGRLFVHLMPTYACSIGSGGADPLEAATRAAFKMQLAKSHFAYDSKFQIWLWRRSDQSLQANPEFPSMVLIRRSPVHEEYGSLAVARQP
jgi:hypothetical protein